MSKLKLEAIAETPLSDLIVTTPYQRSVRSFKKLICPPPAAKTEPVQGLAALADSGQAVGIIHFRRYPLAFQFTEPRGFWSSASGSRFGREFVRRFPALRFTPA